MGGMGDGVVVLLSVALVSGKTAWGRGVSYLITNERLVKDTVPLPPPVTGPAAAEAARTATKSITIVQ